MSTNLKQFNLKRSVGRPSNAAVLALSLSKGVSPPPSCSRWVNKLNSKQLASMIGNCTVHLGSKVDSYQLDKLHQNGRVISDLRNQISSIGMPGNFHVIKDNFIPDENMIPQTENLPNLSFNDMNGIHSMNENQTIHKEPSPSTFYEETIESNSVDNTVKNVPLDQDIKKNNIHVENSGNCDSVVPDFSSSVNGEISTNACLNVKSEPQIVSGVSESMDKNQETSFSTHCDSLIDDDSTQTEEQSSVQAEDVLKDVNDISSNITSAAKSTDSNDCDDKSTGNLQSTEISETTNKPVTNETDGKLVKMMRKLCDKSKKIFKPTKVSKRIQCRKEAALAKKAVETSTVQSTHKSPGRPAASASEISPLLKKKHGLKNGFTSKKSLIMTGRKRSLQEDDKGSNQRKSTSALFMKSKKMRIGEGTLKHSFSSLSDDFFKKIIHSSRETSYVNTNPKIKEELNENASLLADLRSPDNHSETSLTAGKSPNKTQEKNNIPTPLKRKVGRPPKIKLRNKVKSSENELTPMKRFLSPQKPSPFKADTIKLSDATVKTNPIKNDPDILSPDSPLQSNAVKNSSEILPDTRKRSLSNNLPSAKVDRTSESDCKPLVLKKTKVSPGVSSKQNISPTESFSPSVQKEKLDDDNITRDNGSECDFTESKKEDESEENSGSSKILSCPSCDFKTSRKHSMHNHVRRHTGEGMMQCPGCSYQTLHIYLMRIHVAEKHAIGKVFTCMKCPFKSARREVVRKHMMVHIRKGEAEKSCLEDFRKKYTYDNSEERRTFWRFKRYEKKESLAKLDPNEIDFIEFLSNHGKIDLKNISQSKKPKIQLETIESEDEVEDTEEEQGTLRCYSCTFQSFNAAVMETHRQSHACHQTILCPFGAFKCSDSNAMDTHLMNHETKECEGCEQTENVEKTASKLPKVLKFLDSEISGLTLEFRRNIYIQTCNL